MIGYFDLRFQPELETILNGLPNAHSCSPISKFLLSAATINADELFANADPTISFIMLKMILYNNEGANRTLAFKYVAGNNILLTSAVTTGTALSLTQTLYFGVINATVALANVTSAFTFVGYRIIS
jgi:hypothetical protein